MHLTLADMPIVPLFFFKLSVSLALVWGFYQAVLRRMTFHSLNRWYLLGYTLISFCIPFINIAPLMSDRPAGEPVMLQFIPAIGGAARSADIPVAVGATVSAWMVLFWVFLAGAAVMLARLAVRWISLVRLRRKARLIGGIAVKVYQVDGPTLPFSFGNAIYVNQRLYTEKEWEDIILHEYVHVRQRHTIDILIAELVCVINWYNPFAWLIRHSIRQNLEFIADQEVLNKGVDRKGYQYHLLKVVGEPLYGLANNFNFSSLRKRIIMMNRVRSARVHLLKLLFLLPLVAMSLAAFRDRGAKLSGPRGPIYIHAAGIAINVPDRKLPEEVVVREQETGLHTTTDAKRRAVPRPVAANDTIPVLQKGPVEGIGQLPGALHRDSLGWVAKYLGNGPLILVNGRVAPSDTLKTLNPDDIQDIRVYKDSSWDRTLGKRASNGVISIRTKNWKAPLVLIDGREADVDSAMRISPTDIESVNLVTGQQARVKYGEKGKNGAIVVITKKKTSFSLPARGSGGVQASTKDGSITIVADSLEIGGLQVTDHR